MNDWQTDLVREARSWIGTPFHAHAAIKGAGVDCVHLAEEIYLPAGVINRIAWPEYTLDGGHHADESAIVRWLQRSGEFLPLTGPMEGYSMACSPEMTPTTGDLLLFRIGRVPWHVGIVIEPPRFVHALERHGVIESDLRDGTYSSRLRAVWRPVKVRSAECGVGN